MTTLLRPVEPWVHEPGDDDGFATCFGTNGFAVVRGLVDPGSLDEMADELEELRQALTDGRLDPRHGSDALEPVKGTVDGRPFRHFLVYTSEISAHVARLVRSPELAHLARLALGDGVWLMEHERLGVYYQHARTSPGSGYSRLGWHVDWESTPNLPIWPAVAVTVHLDDTSAENGFLRVLPGSHLTPPSPRPQRFTRQPGELAVLCERGDVLVHHSHLWHAAARGSEDGPGGARRHVRARFCAGRRIDGWDGDFDHASAAR